MNFTTAWSPQPVVFFVVFSPWWNSPHMLFSMIGFEDCLMYLYYNRKVSRIETSSMGRGRIFDSAIRLRAWLLLIWEAVMECHEVGQVAHKVSPALLVDRYVKWTKTMRSCNVFHPGSRTSLSPVALSHCPAPLVPDSLCVLLPTSIQYRSFSQASLVLI